MAKAAMTIAKGKAKAPAKKPVKTPARRKAPAAKPMLTIKQRDRLLAAAIKVLQKETYRAFTVARVAEKAKLDLALVKRTFPSKLHLLAATLETNLELDTDASEELILGQIDFRTSTADALTQMVMGQVERHDKGGWLRLFVNMDIAESEPEHADIWRMVEHRLADRGTRIVSEMQRRGYIDETLDPRWVQFFWNSLMDGIAVRARALPEGAGYDEVAKGITPILLRGFAPKRS
jgi:AcrR family transcriptional regulator